MYTLYGTTGSGAAVVAAALAVIGAQYRNVDASSWDEGPGRDELARINPLVQIPTLILPEGTVMSESGAILIELGLRHPESGLLPQEPAARARVIRGLVYLGANNYAATGINDYPERWCDAATEDDIARIRKGTQARAGWLWDVFADTFFHPTPAEPWLGGAQLNALDIMAAILSKWTGARKHLAQSRPDFLALMLKIEKTGVMAEIQARYWPPEGPPDLA
ncbi:glutathione S-transferase family protein [Amantichitinum ursilacus]|uniref:GST N-terminal domain-containing protein n=1 Tax=Amantichitinum ursilacus TaxID=857265 RepID=A0A0N1JTP6_9NEIS|nr:glutathione S-transferase N-terminal domain-containing protein [Amantichitinum ursilacus]KPC55177.1 hypothetical protein WG78_00925 [Amantichitinum ursilacus]